MIKTYEINRRTTSETDVMDLTQEVADKVADSGIQQGQVHVFTPGSTVAVTTIEYEPGVVEDLKRAIEQLAPQHIKYAHDARWGDGNGYAHVRSAILGGSFTIPVIDRRLALGTWQQVVLLDFDNRSRERRIIIQVSGE